MELLRPAPADRTYEQLLRHYTVEKQLANRLRETSSWEERKAIYESMYDELFAQVPDHPRLVRRDDKESTEATLRRRAGLVTRFIDESKTFVEFGPGDCRFSYYLSGIAKQVYGVDIADQRGEEDKGPTNFELVVYDGHNLDFEDSIADVVFSDQLIEHIHPDDLQHHFGLAMNLLKDGGIYVLRTPHLYSGPHDVSRFFSDSPEGFHLKEYTYRELDSLLRQAGFRIITGHRLTKGYAYQLPWTYFRWAESFLESRYTKHRDLARYLLPAVYMVAQK
ncbi:MAG: methyltransferase domain-containing protein [Pseudomonadota bacterium]